MKKNNKGFIAISLIYSFFLVFLVTLLGITMDYAQNRILLNDVKKTTQEYLNTLSEFNPVKLPNKNYNIGEELTYAGEEWIVLENKAKTIKLILKNSLSFDVISRTFTKNQINQNSTIVGSIAIAPPIFDDGSLIMCLNKYNNDYANYCSYDVTENYKHNTYTWENSLVKMVVDDWFENSSVLQKAKDAGGLVSETFSDGIKVYNDSYIRIPTDEELMNIYYTDIPKLKESLPPANTMWNLTYATDINGQSYISSKIESTVGELAHNTYKVINPVIVVKKV